MMMRTAPRLPALALRLVAALLASVVPVAASAGTEVAELTVVAYGAQRFDLATGFTELLDGGEIVDRSTGVRLAAPWLRYSEGEALEAHDAVVEGPFGRLSAPRVSVDLARGRLDATMGVALEGGTGVVVRAERILYDATTGWAVASGDVGGESPSFAAEVVWAHVETGRLVLEAPYLFDDGPLRLRSARPGARLQLTPIRDAEGRATGYDATTDLDDDVLERLEAGLE